MGIMRGMIDSGADFKQVLDSCNISKQHSVCGLLKVFIKELPTPIIPDSQLDAFISSLTIKDEEEKMERYKKLVDNLPEEERILMSRYLLLFVKIVNSEKTLLTPETLGMVFGTNFTNRDANFLALNIKNMNTVCSYLIINYFYLFGVEDFIHKKNIELLKEINDENFIENINNISIESKIEKKVHIDDEKKINLDDEKKINLDDEKKIDIDDEKKIDEESKIEKEESKIIDENKNDESNNIN
jgi:hypothetical protein